MKVKLMAELVAYSSVMGGSVMLLGPGGYRVGQLALLCEDPVLRNKDTQQEMWQVIVDAINKAAEGSRPEPKTASPMFGHDEDPVTDFCREVLAIERDLSLTPLMVDEKGEVLPDTLTMLNRMDRAMLFQANVDYNAVEAKRMLMSIILRVKQMLTEMSTAVLKTNAHVQAQREAPTEAQIVPFVTPYPDTGFSDDIHHQRARASTPAPSPTLNRGDLTKEDLDSGYGILRPKRAPTTTLIRPKGFGPKGS